MKKQENQKAYCNGIDDNPVNDLWNNGIIYAFEFVRGHKKALSSPQVVKDVAKKQVSKKPVSSHELSNSLQSKMNKNNSRESPPLANSRVGQNNLECNNHSQDSHSGRFGGVPRNCWEPIGWDGILELVQTVQVDACWEEPNGFTEDDDDVTVADVAAPYWERPVGPTCSFLLYSQVPVRVACGLLFELLGQSAGDPLVNEDDIPVVLRSWQSQNFLVTALHVKGSAQNVNVLGISEVQELLAAEGISMPRNIHEVIVLD